MPDETVSAGGANSPSVSWRSSIGINASNFRFLATDAGFPSGRSPPDMTPLVLDAALLFPYCPCDQYLSA
jgi:hypothetical protein